MGQELAIYSLGLLNARKSKTEIFNLLHHSIPIFNRERMAG